MTAVAHPRNRSLDLSLFRGGRIYLWLTAFSIIAAAASLHWPSTPSYDPWSWLIWGREIYNAVTGSGPLADHALHITGGSSWKPLPVIFTTIFALFGSAQPNLWLVIARAGGLLTVLVSAKFAMRITWSLVSGSGGGTDTGSGESWTDRLMAYAPVAFAGAVTLICTTFTLGYPGNMLDGYSEGVMTAGFLIACERAWDGHHRQAFVIGIIPCLDRPEVWPVWGLYGLWLMWHDREARKLVIGMGVLMLALWVVPQKLGGGSVTSLATHAQGNHSRQSAVYASFPFWAEMSTKLWPLVLERLEAASLILLGITAYQVTRAKQQLGNWDAALRRHPAAVAGSLAGLFGFVWWLGISVETQAGFAGNPRYAVIGVMLVDVSGAVAYGWACTGLARLAGNVINRRFKRNASWRLRATGATAFMVLFFMFVPGWFAHRMPSVASIRYSVRYQAQLREEDAALIDDYGGAAAVLRCGSIMTHNLQVTQLAWYLGVPIKYVQALPVYAKGELTTKVRPGPNVVFQDGATSTHATDQGPTPAQMQVWNQGWQQKNGTSYKVIFKSPVTLYADCSAYIKKAWTPRHHHR
jgi:hypothetical protein